MKESVNIDDHKVSFEAKADEAVKLPNALDAIYKFLPGNGIHCDTHFFSSASFLTVQIHPNS